MEQITQEQIDTGVEQARDQWKEMLSESGMEQALFIASNKEAIQFLGEYQSMKEVLLEQGWTIPDLIDGVKINLNDASTD